MLPISIILLFALASAKGRGPHHPTVSHHHYHPQPSEKKLLSDTELLHDQRHINEELGEWADDSNLPQLSDDEIEFRYFKVHDLDNNTKLDGLEIYQAIKHTLDSSSSQDPHAWAETELTVVKLIDQVLHEDDLDFDGYLTYAEYSAGRAKEKKESKQ